jgi:hypothetical protein
MRRFRVRRFLASIGFLLACRPAFAQQPPPPPDASALAKETQNPVSSLITVPLQFNFNSGGDLGDGTLFNLNFQPVIPFKATSEINVIARTIVPINSAPGPDGSRFSGVGDIQMQLFLTPAAPGPLILGIGPMFSLPTATATPFQTGTFGAGFSAVVVKNQGPFVLGGLLSQVWPAGDSGGEPQANLFTLQPFVNYNFGGGWAASFAPIIAANWDASDGNEWTVPLGLGMTRTTVFDGRPMNIGFQYYYNVTRPDGAPAQQFRFTVAFLCPERR